jgi:enolase-phosphatase E1
MAVACAGILLDIEGTTSSISFVTEVMFPFVRRELNSYLAKHWSDAATQDACQLIVQGYDSASQAAWQTVQNSPEAAQDLIQRIVHDLMDRDVKQTGLKQLQGLIWEAGFASGELTAQLYPDVLPALQYWQQQGLPVRIYSSGSIAAQKLFFGHTLFGNLLNYFTGHYDTTIGSKSESASYLAIAKDWGIQPELLLFVSDLSREVMAAQAAGLQTALSVRPGNAVVGAEYTGLRITSFAELYSG